MSISYFNHSNIITKFVFRKFDNVEHMNRVMIERHNSRVKPGHTVYHLGDFRMSNEGPNVHELMAQLNGNHVFICGNHDKNNGLNTPLRYAVIDTYGTRILLIHDPSDAGPILEGYRSIKMAFVAHKHLAWRFDDNMVNVGVDQWDYYPVDAKQILKAYKRWKEE